MDLIVVFFEVHHTTGWITFCNSIEKETTIQLKVKVLSEFQQKYSIKILLKLAELKRSTYYYHMSKKDRDFKHDEIMNKIITIYYTHQKRYGYRRITLTLKSQGITINHKKVKWLMYVMVLYGKSSKIKYKSYKGDFGAKQCRDVIEFHVAAGKLYLSPIIDMHNL